LSGKRPIRATAIGQKQTISADDIAWIVAGDPNHCLTPDVENEITEVAEDIRFVLRRTRGFASLTLARSALIDPRIVAFRVNPSILGCT